MFYYRALNITTEYKTLLNLPLQSREINTYSGSIGKLSIEFPRPVSLDWENVLSRTHCITIIIDVLN